MKIFNLPDLGEGLPDAKIVAWHVKVGDNVTIDQLLVSVETAKALVDIPSPRSGCIECLCVNSGEVLDTGKPLVIFTDDLNDKELTNINKSDTVVGQLKVTPAVRNLAKKLDIDLNSIKPTGPNNTITVNDLEQAKDGFETVSYTSRAMALAMQKSSLEVVTSIIFEDLILEDPLDLDLTVNLMLAISYASKEEPILNAWFKQDLDNNFKLKIFKEVNLGIAVDSIDGLFVPVIKNIEAKSEQELRAELNLLKQQIETRKIALDKLQDPSFILSNFGKFAGKYAVPIVLPPTVAILAVGKFRKKLVIINNQNLVKTCVPLSLAFDHRAVTGGQAARFLAAILKFFSNI